MAFRNNFSYIHFLICTWFIRCFKIITMKRKVRCHRVKAIHCPAKELIPCYLVSEVATLHISHRQSCTEANVWYRTLHCATIFTQCVSAFVGYVIYKVIHINIKSNKIILVLFKNITEYAQENYIVNHQGKNDNNPLEKWDTPKNT